MSASTSSRREMLQATTWASPPDLRMPAATSSQASALRLEITTLAPSLARSSAEERPMPRLDPVMTATFPVRSNGVDCIFVSSAYSVPIGLSFRDARRHRPGIHARDNGYGFRTHDFVVPRNDRREQPYPSPPLWVTRRR